MTKLIKAFRNFANVPKNNGKTWVKSSVLTKLALRGRATGDTHTTHATLEDPVAALQPYM
jgi:hypothetical protein